MSVTVTSRSRGAVRAQSGHFVIGTGPYYGHGVREAEAELDIFAGVAVLRRQRRRRKGKGTGEAGEDATVAGDGSGAEMAPPVVLYKLEVVGPTR